MCGIIAVINGEKSWGTATDFNRYMAQGCVTGIFRGEDSTGMFQTNKNWETKILKSTANGYDFSQNKRVQDLLRNTDNNLCTVIHHRAATLGNVSYNNAHPFEHEMDDGTTVVGVHNGTVHGFSRREDGFTFDVDSDWLYYKIAKEGPEKALGNITAGAFALMWMEKQSKRIYIAANGERPLHFAFVKGKNAVLVASEHGMLFWLANRNGIQLDGMLYPAAGCVYSFNPEGNLRDYEATAFEKPVVVPVKSYNSQQGNNVVPYKPHVRSGPDGPSNSYDNFYTPKSVETDTHRITDYWGPTRTAETGFQHRELVEFFIDPKRISNNSNSPNCTVFGEATTNMLGKITPAVIISSTRTCVDNMLAANEVQCRAIGKRVVTDKKTGEITEYLILTIPEKILNARGDVATDEAEPILSLIGMEDLEDFDIWDNKEDSVRGPRARMIARKDYLRLVKDGCAMCTDSVTIADCGKIAWTEQNEPLCPTCAEEMARS